MGPLIPQSIISGDLNFFFAFLIGIGFGYILEQAGFSSSRKLAGVFYGYDFVVLKVFFTAGITAATGVFFFSYLGWIDIEMIYINPLYLHAAIVGGVIMGFGFILGGFCPGTGIAAAVIGKIDAIIFVIGIVIGVAIFGVFFKTFEPLYNAKFLGNVFVYDSLGMSRPWFLLALVLMALGAFYVTQKIQDKSSRFKELTSNTQNLKLTYPVVFIILLAIIAVVLPQQKKTYLHEISTSQIIEKISEPERVLPPERIAYSIINDRQDILLIDVRSADEFADFHLPGAINISLENILNKTYSKSLIAENKRTVFYSNGAQDAELAWFMATRAGLGDFHILEGGLNNFISVIFQDVSKEETKDIMELSERKFIESAQQFFREGEVYKRKTSGEIPAAKTDGVKPVKGGC